MSSEESDSQMSAMFDDELPRGQCELLVRRLVRDTALRTSWGRYATVGAVLRNEPLALCCSGRTDMAGRLRAALEAEPALATVAIRNSAPRTSWYKAALGAALAASVAAVSILALRVQAPEGPARAAVAVAVSAPAPAVTPAPSYVVPPSSDQLGVRTSAQLANYVVAHSEYTSPVARLNRLSSFMTSDIDADGDSDDATHGDAEAAPGNVQKAR
jgi:sigma-E factor negative regulatory protein RseA